MLQLKNVIKNYYVGEQTIKALKGVNIDFRRNEFVSILGPSGCGKTTLMNIIGGLDKYTDGDLVVEGVSTKDYASRDWDNYRNKRIGFVFQSYNLITHLTVLGNVELALTISGISLEERRRRAKEALVKVGLGDYLKQKPNELSGGQMQRVAIARAIVNEPEILLADEPTGALDTETSEQIMELISEISRDKLVIMVTHNPELAERYSTRLVKMLDGKIIDDSMPYVHEEKLEEAVIVPEEEIINPKKRLLKFDKRKPKDKKSSMRFSTALSLSWANLLTKKGRTILTSIAGSIGIIGIALILAISGGLNNYIEKIQLDTLSVSPITISEMALDIDKAMATLSSATELEKFPTVKKIFVKEAKKATDFFATNVITQEYVDYIEENLDAEWCADIVYKTDMTIPIYGIKEGEEKYTSMNTSNWQRLLKKEFITSQYEVVEGGGRYPENKNEIAIIVDETNHIHEDILVRLGILENDSIVTEYTFEEILGREYKLIKNDELYYQKDNGIFAANANKNIDFYNAETLTIVGILRIKPSTQMGVLSTGIGYLEELYGYLQEVNDESLIVKYMDANPDFSPFTGARYATNDVTNANKRKEMYRSLGGEKVPNEILIYPKDFESKDYIKIVLNGYNIGKKKSERIVFTDYSEIIASTIKSFVDIISYVLIAFTAISLIVSSIMIAIITYVSVLERTKEIGILRSIGARKKDVMNVFVAETFIIGAISGIIGIAVTYLLTVPINLIINSLINVEKIASLHIGYAGILVGISIALTMISGIVPAYKSTKKDPVKALRTE